MNADQNEVTGGGMQKSDSASRFVYKSKDSSKQLIAQGFQGSQQRSLNANTQLTNDEISNFVNYGSIKETDKSFEHLDKVRNLRSLRSRSSSIRNSIINDLEVDQIEVNSNAISAHKRRIRERQAQETNDDYVLFLALLNLIVFEILAVIKMSKLIDWYWIFLVIPLEISLFLITYLVLKKGAQALERIVTDSYRYYFYLILKILTLKSLVGLITFAALVELFPFLIKEADIAATTAICLSIVWLSVILIYYSELETYSKRLPNMLIQNMVLLIAFFINLMVHLNYSEDFSNYLVLLSPLFANFTLNIVTIRIFEKTDNIKHPIREIIINSMLLAGTVQAYFILEGIFPSIFNLEYLLVYLIIIEIYFFVLAMELNEYD
eukprot:403348236